MDTVAVMGANGKKQKVKDQDTIIQKGKIHRHFKAGDYYRLFSIGMTTERKYPLSLQEVGHAVVANRTAKGSHLP